MKKFTQLQIHKDNLASLLLFGGVVLALVVSNSEMTRHYFREVISTHFYIGFGDYELNKTLLKWVNDGLMAIFFFLLGLEMKYHVTQGEFQNKRTLLLPFLAALGGCIIPAGLYYFINCHNPAGQVGWSIPIATDTAFVLAIITFFGNHISNSAKIFLIGLSIIDDVIAVSVLAVFYTPHLNIMQLSFCAIPLLALALLNINKVAIPWLYYFAGFILWIFTVKSGVHGTIAGIIIAFFIPVVISHEGQNIQLLKQVEASVHNLVAFFVLPLFAFVNCELSFQDLSMRDITSTIAIGSFVGLFLGKALGIYSFTAIAIKCKVGRWPQDTTPLIFLGLSFLCGIGFTLSLFIGLQAFDTIIFENQMKVGVLSASLLSAIVGSVIIHQGIQRKNKATPSVE